MTDRLIIAMMAVLLCAGFTTLEAADIPEPKFDHQTVDKISIGYGVAIGDVDGDGKPDIVLADKKQFVWYQNPGSAGKPWAKHIMVENLTARDNVCLAVRDIDGDGKVEVAVGAQWNPGNTSSAEQSGSVHYLVRPKDPTQKWKPIKLVNDPTIHRMRWVRVTEDRYDLIVLPLHGIGNKGGKGKGVRVMGYIKPADPSAEWKTYIVIDSMHMTHNFSPVNVDRDSAEEILLAGREGATLLDHSGDNKWKALRFGSDKAGCGEVRLGRLPGGKWFACTVEPMHGNMLAIYTPEKNAKVWPRQQPEDSLRAGHALACADLLGIGRDQIVVGWRNPDAQKKVGIKLYVPTNDAGTAWKQFVIDDNQMACEDLRLGDLDGDGKVDIVAAGRGTKNLKIYWNKTAGSK